MVKIMLICYFKLTTGFSNLLAVKKFLISYPFHWVLIAFEQMLHPSHPFCDERDLLLSACLVLKLLWFTQLIWVVWFSLFQVYFIFFRFSIPSFRRRSLSAWLSGVWHYFPARYCLLAGFRLVDDTVPEPESPLPTADRLAVAKVGASRPRRAPSLSPLTVPPTPSATPPSYPYLHLEENLHHKLSSHRFPHISTTPARLEPNSMSPLLAAKTLKQLRNRYKYKYGKIKRKSFAKKKKITNAKCACCWVGGEGRE